MSIPKILGAFRGKDECIEQIPILIHHVGHQTKNKVIRNKINAVRRMASLREVTSKGWRKNY